MIAYWKNVFEPSLQKAYGTMHKTKEYGNGVHHCNELQMMIGSLAGMRRISRKEAYGTILHDYETGQRQAIDDGKIVYVNKNFGWHAREYTMETKQFVHKTNFEFPRMEKDRIEIKQFPMGKHFYVFIDGVQLWDDDNVKFDSREEAESFAEWYCKP